MSTNHPPQKPSQPQKPAPPVTQAVDKARPVDRVRDLLNRSKDSLAMALPRHIKPEYMIRVALTEVQRNPALLECNPRSLIGAIFQCAQLGLSLDAQLGQAFLVPYKQNITLIPGYRGLIQLALRSGRVQAITARVVRKGDLFEWEEGSSPRIVHKPKLVTKIDTAHLDAEFVAVYAVAYMKGGGLPQFAVMSRAQVQAIRARSAAGNKGPWVTDPEAMWRKTPTRQLCKWLPMETDRAAAMVQAVTLDEQAEAGLDQKLDLLAPDAILDDTEASGLDRLTEAMQRGQHEPLEPLGGAELADEDVDEDVDDDGTDGE